MLATVTRPSASSIWRSWSASTGSSASDIPTAIRPPATSVPVSVAASAATHASGPTSAVTGISAPNTVMLSAPTSANWARLNAVRIGMWRRSSSSTTPGPTMQASISSDGSARNRPATSGTSASDSDSALWRKLTWTTNTSAAAKASASAHHGSCRSPAGASRWRTSSTKRIAAMEAMAAIRAQTGPSERRRAKSLRATLIPLRGAGFTT